MRKKIGSAYLKQNQKLQDFTDFLFTGAVALGVIAQQTGVLATPHKPDERSELVRGPMKFPTETTCYSFVEFY